MPRPIVLRPKNAAAADVLYDQRYRPAQCLYPVNTLEELYKIAGFKKKVSKKVLFAKLAEQFDMFSSKSEVKGF